MLERLSRFLQRVGIYQLVYGNRRGLWFAVAEKVSKRRGQPRAATRDEHPEVLVRTDSADLLIYLSVLVGQEYEFTLASAPRTIVDAGAHIGLASIWFARRYPEARIIAIEPELENYRLLVRNTARYPNVTPRRAALWSTQQATVTVSDPGFGSWGFQASDTGEGPSVEAVTIPDVMDRYGFDAIDLLKIDIEGAEREVFEHSASWIDRVDAVIAELHDRLQPGCSRAFFRALSDFTDEQWRGENVLVRRPVTVRAG